MTGLSPTAQKLKSLREKAGLTVRQLAEQIDLRHTSYAYYESPKFKKRHLPMELAEKLAPHLLSRGIEQSEIFALAGVATSDESLGQSGQMGGLRDSQGSTYHHDAIVLSGNIAEVDVRASAGGGSVVDDEREERRWHFPDAWVRAELNTRPAELRIVTIEGDSMVSDPPSPRDLLPGDKAVINIGDRRPSPPGVFVLHDGLGLVAKRVEFIADSDPPTIRILSNNQAYPEYQRTLEEAHIFGRVVGRWQRL